MNAVDCAFAETHLAGLDFEAFVGRLAEEPVLLNWMHFRPQHEYVRSGDRVLVDCVGRYENLEGDFAFVANRLGKPADLPLRNADTDGRTPVAQETRALVRQIYAIDYQTFCY